MSETINWKELSPRERDAVVAEGVMGGVRKCWFVCPKCGGTYFGTNLEHRVCHDEYKVGCRWSGDPKDATPLFTTNIAAAWEVVEQITERHKTNLEREGEWELVLDSYGDWYKGWTATFETCSPEAEPEFADVRRTAIGHGHSPAEAICIAALRAKGYEVLA